MLPQTVKVGIDLTGLGRVPDRIASYTTEMVKQLLFLSPIEPEFRYVLFFARDVPSEFLPMQYRFETIICPTNRELWGKQCWFPALLPFLGLDVMHYPLLPPPYVQLNDPAMVMTFYDASSWRYPQSLTFRERLYARSLLARGTITSEQIVTLSEYAQAELVRFLGKYCLSKMALAPGVAQSLFTEATTDEERQEVLARYHLPSTAASFFLAVSGPEPWQNLSTLLEAYLGLRRLFDERADGTVCPPLLLVGRQEWEGADILPYILPLQDHVIFLDRVPAQDMLSLYQQACCLIFPSFYEYFGFPVLEAMTAGCPVIASTVSAVPEVTADAALQVNPHDTSAMMLAMQSLLRDDALRQQLIAKGREQAAKFSWEQVAYIYRQVYLNAYDRHYGSYGTYGSPAGK
jgi:glycosyltransferase involved in cell wall biosynthesis